MFEFREQALKNRFGAVYEINKDDWMREVTEASNSCWVLVNLYQDSVEECRIMEAILIDIAAKFKALKIVKIRSTQAVENWPDKNLPTLFFYHDGALKNQILTLKELGGKSTTVEGILQ